MSEISDRLSALTPEQRTLLELLRKKNKQAALEAQTIKRREPDSRCPASFEQERLWFIQQLDPASPANNITNGICLDGELSVGALERSLNEIIRRHESLRTSFSSIEGRPAQVIAPELRITLPVVELQALDDDQREAEAQRLVTAQAQQPFDLARLPLCKFMLLRLSDRQYALAVTMHHIITDWWSFGIFYKEMTILYEAFSTGKPSPLPELPIQFADVAIWQRGWLQGKAVESNLVYWKQKLDDAPPVQLELSTDYPRQPLQTFAGARYFLTLSQSLSEKLKALAQRAAVTPFMLMLAAFNVLLYKYSRQDDIVLGTPVSNRHAQETETLIGYFLDMMALRTNLAGDPTFHELLKRVREVVVGAYAHQAVPFVTLLESLSLHRDLSRMPLFEVAFIYVQSEWQGQRPDLSQEQAPVSSSLLTGGLDVNTGISRFDMTLAVTDAPDGLINYFEYKIDLFSPATIERMASHFQTLLEGMVAQPNARLSQLPLLNEAEMQQLLVEWNQTARQYPREACIHHLFELQVKRTPEKAALVSGPHCLTFRELNERANQLARHLRAEGAGPESPVGILMHRSIESVVALLAVLKAGAAYVPLDPTYPQARLAFMMDDARLSLLVTQGHLAAAPGFKGRVVNIDADGHLIEQQNREDLDSRVTGDNLAYVIYTSGSMGQPKGVMGCHQAMLNRFDWMWGNYPFKPDEVCCQKTSLSFVDSIWETFGPLLKGVTLAVIPDDLVKDTMRLVESLAANRVTRIVLVPSLLRALLETGEVMQMRLAQIKLWVTSGEALPAEVCNRFVERLPGSRLLNLYGSSEVAADVTGYEVTEKRAQATVPVGRPIANTRVYLLDDYYAPVPVGVAGDLCVAGDGLARGYLGMPELTAQLFTPDPFAIRPGARLFKTGDTARYLPDGDIEFLGRLDQQVKVRGFRVEVGEIEYALNNHPDIKQAVVTAKGERTGDARLVGYVVARSATRPTVADLRRFLGVKLPDYMLPSAFVWLDSLPLTSSGKVYRRALPDPEKIRPELEVEHLAPQTEMEQIITAIWEQILQLEGIGIEDSIFDLGGHSLLLGQAQYQILERTGKEVTLIEMFQYSTIKSLAAFLSRGEQADAPAAKAQARADQQRQALNRRRRTGATKNKDDHQELL